MVQTQGLRPPDPYHVLQLHPNAPRALIDEAYWSLSQRRRANGRSSDGCLATATDLHAAYAALVELERNAGSAHQATNGFRADGQPDFYEILCLDPSADARIIDLAHLLLSREAQHDATGARQRALDDAYRVLSNARLRQQYDAARTLALASDAPVSTSSKLPRPGREPPGRARKPLLHFVGDRTLRERREARLLTLRGDTVDR